MSSMDEKVKFEEEQKNFEKFVNEITIKKKEFEKKKEEIIKNNEEIKKKLDMIKKRSEEIKAVTGENQLILNLFR